MAIKKDGAKQKKNRGTGNTIKAPSPVVEKPVLIDMSDPRKLAENNAYLASFPEMNVTPIMELDREGNFIYVNPACKRLFPDLLKLGTKHPFFKDWLKVIQELDSVEATHPVVHTIAVDKFFFEQTYFAINKNRVRIYCKDITRRKKAEEESELQSQLLNACSDSILWTNSHGKFIYINEAAGRTHGYTHDELMNVNINDMIVPEYRQIAKSKIGKVLQTGDVIFECAHFLKDGSVMPVEIHARVFKWKGKEHVLGISRDITERKKAEEALRRSEMNLRNTIDNSPLGICIWNTNKEAI